MIKVESLTKHYGTVTAIEDVSFEVARGEVVGFLGPNGAGKTTTMRILTCFMPASSGRASVAGYDVFKESLDVRRHIGYLPENVPLYTEMTVDAYLKYVAKIKGIPRHQRAERIDKALESCGLTHMRRRIIGHLSRGYRQRVGLAQALVHDPDVLILDEPTSGLDPIQRVEIRELIQELGKDHTVILSTHILPEASMTCERVLVIHQGKIVGDLHLEEGEVVSMQADGASLDRSHLLHLEVSALPQELMARLDEMPHIIGWRKREELSDGNPHLEIQYDPDYDVRSEVAAAVVACGTGLLELRRVSQSLEEAFLQLTSGEGAMLEATEKAPAPGVEIHEPAVPSPQETEGAGEEREEA